MATTALEGNPVHTSGDLPAVGTQAPAYTLVGNDLGEVNSSEFADSRVVLNIFPSVDTGVCAASVRRFNELAASLENTTVVCVSNDLPFAQARFCGAESIDDVVTASAFRSAFGKEYGVTMVDGPLAGLLARAVVVLDDTGTVIYTQLVDEITTEPDYDAAMAALGA
ncbi:thiol peroxidase [Brevibacterium sp. 2SA]|uniref:thiol peroxidase n=1 Tax=Brevibacterium sp. 2SA TaxID=2502198 RepID=UPI0010F53D51|nr:thiol peroxidase [Brevibacterium sp. 2SA]